LKIDRSQGITSEKPRFPLADLILKVLVLLDDWGWLLDVLAEDVALDEVRKPHFQLIAEVAFRWDGENLCERRQYGGLD